MFAVGPEAAACLPELEVVVATFRVPITPALELYSVLVQPCGDERPSYHEIDGKSKW